MKIENYLHLYLGCDTNYGKLVGINGSTYYILSQNGEIIKGDVNEAAPPIKPILRKFNDLGNLESSELNNKGISIGQRKGYTFTPEAIVYLLTLRIDLFNLIGEGLAIDSNQPR